MTEEQTAKGLVLFDPDAVRQLSVLGEEAMALPAIPLGQVIPPTPPLLNLKDHPELFDVPVEIRAVEVRSGNYGPYALLHCTIDGVPQLIATGARLVCQRVWMARKQVPIQVRFVDLGGYFTIEDPLWEPPEE